jgi:hypothetical protein
MKNILFVFSELLPILACVALVVYTLLEWTGVIVTVVLR